MLVSCVVASQYNESRVFSVLNGSKFNNFLPYLYKSEDEGQTWINIGTGLPNEPINVIREDPKSDSIIYVGTDGGLYVSFDLGKTYMLWNKGMPPAPVHDIAIQKRENDIVVGTHGRSIYITKLNDLQELRKDPDWLNKKAAKFKSGIK
jgi:hypothetical protein